MSAATVPVAHKFGGSSLGDAKRIAHVADVLTARSDPAQVIVVSAMQGVTDALIRLVRVASEDGSTAEGQLDLLAARHRQTAFQLLGEDHGELVERLWRDWNDLTAALRTTALLGHPSADLLDYVQGLGEVWSAQILTALLRARGEDAGWLDAREVLVVERGPLGVGVDWARTGERLARWRERQPLPARLVVTGFIARTSDGRPTTLGRNGSDYSAAIFARLFGARELHIWTDVDGVLSADPRRVPDAVLLPALSYEEAFELAYFGAKVLHPETMSPLVKLGTPVYVRNTFRPEHEGTRIGPDPVPGPGPVKGLTIAPDLALVEVIGSGMIGVPGTAERVFGALRAAGVSVVMIAQASSEHSICCTVREADAARAVQVLREAFARELEAGLIQSITAEGGVAVLAAVGDGMAGHPGTAARLFSGLARAEVNVRAIAQGGTERNISVAIRQEEATRALRAVHAGFWLSPQTLSIGLIGPGQVGSELLDQIAAAAPRLRAGKQLDLRLRGIAGSTRMHLAERWVDWPRWRSAYVESGLPVDLDAFAAHIKAPHLPHAMIIDCTASAEVARHYPRWLAEGIHVVTPNKHGGSAPLAQYLATRAACTRAHWRYEATVGAGLPVIGTLRDLIDTGDEVHAIEGILSGTLSYLFQRYDGSRPFSELVLEARSRGFTEPDPREDLSGMDVARKLVILAREWGREIELEDVALEGLVPDPLARLERDAFLERIHELDALLADRIHGARGRGKVLRFVARVDAEGARVGLAELDQDHAFAHLKPTDNVIQFTTRRYCDNPLVVQGPGAGTAVTAAGVFADLLRIAQALGAQP